MTPTQLLMYNKIAASFTDTDYFNLFEKNKKLFKLKADAWKQTEKEWKEMTGKKRFATYFGLSTNLTKKKSKKLKGGWAKDDNLLF